MTAALSLSSRLLQNLGVVMMFSAQGTPFAMRAVAMVIVQALLLPILSLPPVLVLAQDAAAGGEGASDCAKPDESNQDEDRKSVV